MIPKELEYDRLLDRLYELLPEQAKKPARFEIPKPQVEVHGKSTVIRNFDHIAKVFRREKKHLFKFLCKELGTTGSIEGAAARLKGRFGPATVNKKIEEYAKEYVICPMCGRPDTHFVEMRGVKMLKCEACGAISPVREL